MGIPDWLWPHPAIMLVPLLGAVVLSACENYGPKNLGWKGLPTSRGVRRPAHTPVPADNPTLRCLLADLAQHRHLVPLRGPRYGFSSWPQERTPSGNGWATRTQTTHRARPAGNRPPGRQVTP